MPCARLVGILVLGVALLAVRPVPVAAQPELQMWLNPDVGKQIPRADYRFTFYPDRAVENQEAHFSLMEHRVLGLRARHAAEVMRACTGQ
jgi:hypothetical protein